MDLLSLDDGDSQLSTPRPAHALAVPHHARRAAWLAGSLLLRELSGGLLLQCLLMGSLLLQR